MRLLACPSIRRGHPPGRIGMRFAISVAVSRCVCSTLHFHLVAVKISGPVARRASSCPGTRNSTLLSAVGVLDSDWLPETQRGLGSNAEARIGDGAGRWLRRSRDAAVGSRPAALSRAALKSPDPVPRKYIPVTHASLVCTRRRRRHAVRNSGQSIARYCAVNRPFRLPLMPYDCTFAVVGAPDLPPRSGRLTPLRAINWGSPSHVRGSFSGSPLEIPTPAH